MSDNAFFVSHYYPKDFNLRAACTETSDMQISEPVGGVPEPGTEPCRFPKLEECAHFHYERVQLPPLAVTIQTNMDQSLHSQHSNEHGDEWLMLQVTSGETCWLLQRNLDNFRMLDSQLHQCIYDRKFSQLPDLSSHIITEEIEATLTSYLHRLCLIIDNTVNCGPVLNWLQMDNKGHRLLVPSEESRSINTPAVAAAYSVRRYVSQARDELNLEVGDMISVIDMASPGESIWWRGKRGFQVGFFPQHCVHIIGDKVPRNMPLPPPVVGSLALSPIKPVLRKHGKLIAFFRSFILNRPSRRRLKQSGILKERVFGCDLGEHLLNSGHEIPMVLKCCAEFIETHGIVDGIYRLSGVTSNIQKLRNAFDEDRIPNLYTEDILQDIHSVASLLKMYFRELPNPLCTYQLYQSFVHAVQGCNTSTRNSETDRERLLKMREAVQKLPPPHYRTLEYLMRHLAKVAKHGHSTGMTTRNVAIVWAPNLLRCAELEVGGVAALQGVGVQAVVTEFLICYTDLIFCDHLPNLDRPMMDYISSPKRSRPKSLAISTPTKLITLEEARTKHLMNKECGYIEVGGGPNTLPKKYHTIIELPPGVRKRGHSKRSPMGWRSFFTRRNTSQGALNKSRKASVPGIIVAVSEKAVTESDLTDIKRKLRSVKSAESLTSGHSEPASHEIDILGPLHCLSKSAGHNRSVSHDSYFDTLQSSHNNSEGSLLDLSEIQLNFELEESEMRIFSEDESLMSSPRVNNAKDGGNRRYLTRARPEEFSSANNSSNPSPKKQARFFLSPDSRKRTRLEDQLSDIQFIDCNTPDNSYAVATTTVVALVHADVVHKMDQALTEAVSEATPPAYQPRNKSPRNTQMPQNYDDRIRSDISQRQSINGEKRASKSLIDAENAKKSDAIATPTPSSPTYRQLVDSNSSTPGDYSPCCTDVLYQKLPKSPGAHTPYETMTSPLKSPPKSPTYENVLTTISITYKSPTRSFSAPKSPNFDSVYEDVDIKTENAIVPTSIANLPVHEAKSNESIEKRPKSLNDLDVNQKTPIFNQLKPANNVENSLTDLSLSVVINSDDSSENSDRTSISLPLTPTRGTLSPNVSPTEVNASFDTLSHDLLTPVSCNTSKNASRDTLNDFEETQSKTNFNKPILYNKTPETSKANHNSCDSLTRDDSSLTQNCINSSLTQQSSSNASLTQFDKPHSNGSNVQSNSGENRGRNLRRFEDELSSRSCSKDSSNFGICGSNSTRSSCNFEDNCDMGSSIEDLLINDENNSSEEHLITSNLLEETLQTLDRISAENEDSVYENVAFLGEDLTLLRPQSIDFIEFSPGCESDEVVRSPVVEKRKTEAVDDSVYQQVKYFRRSVHEINALLDGDPKNFTEIVATDDIKADISVENPILNIVKIEIKEPELNPELVEKVVENFDSLETHVYENVEDAQIYENIDFSADSLELDSKKDKICKNLQTPTKQVDVKKLTNKFEVTQEVAVKLAKKIESPEIIVKHVRNYERDSLPPCLRARNLKQAVKTTRSLDEAQFKAEFDSDANADNLNNRRKSFDENFALKINTLPKKLNKPKTLPDDVGLGIHLGHSSVENIATLSETTLSTNSLQQNLNRERIEKIKEERRKFLQEKYRSESFKENKDVLLSRLKVFKSKEDIIEDKGKQKDDTKSAEAKPPRVIEPQQHKSEVAVEAKKTPKETKPEMVLVAKKYDGVATAKFSHESGGVRNKAPSQIQVVQTTPANATAAIRSSIRSKTAIFEGNNRKFERKVMGEGDELDVRLRRRDEEFRKIGDRRPTTYDARERDGDAGATTDRNRKVISVDAKSPRKEKTSPTTYCIKDMKAIFESKSHQ